MIKYEGIKTVNKVSFLCFANSEDQKIEIPIDVLTANRIISYLAKISPGSTLDVRSSEESPDNELDR